MSITIIALTKSEGDDRNDTVYKLEKQATKRGMSFYKVKLGEAFVIANDLFGDKITIHNYDGEGNKINIKPSETACIVRGGALTDIAGRGLTKSLEEAGMFMINRYVPMELCANKFTSSIALKKANINTPRTALVTNEQSIDIALKEIGGKLPVIAKTITGAEGIGVMKIESKESLTSVLQGLWKHDAEIILQEYMDIEYDVRTLVLDGQIFAAMKRKQTTKDDFRTNKSLGNEYEPYDLNEEEQKIVLKAAETSGCYFCGVDTIVNDGTVYVLEVNGSPGTGDSNEISYMNYYGDKKTKINGSKMVDNFLDYISNKDNWSFPKTSVGVIEWVKVEGMKFKAKLDTGNSAGGISIHATEIKEKNGSVSFKINGKTFNKKIEDRKMIYFGGGDNGEERLFVKLSVSIGNRKAKPTLFNLDNREDAIYDVLINKGYMSDENLVVDPSKKFTLGESVKRVSTFREMYI